MGEKRRIDVMLSSTFLDLEEHRAAVLEAMNGHLLQPLAQEFDAALPGADLIKASLDKIDSADAYVCIIGSRYGQRPVCPERNPLNLSLTELEYRRAVERGLPRCVFIMGAEHGLTRADLDRSVAEGTDSHVLRAKLIELARKDRIAADFTSADDLKAKAATSFIALRKLLDAPYSVESNPHTRAWNRTFLPPQFECTVYRTEAIAALTSLINASQVVCIAGLPGSGKSHTASQFVSSAISRSLFSRCLWYEPSKHSTIEEFLADVATDVTPAAGSISAKCHLLLSAIEARRELLVIEDFHLVDQASYAMLLNQVFRRHPNVRILLTARIHPDVLFSNPAAKAFALPSFTESETQVLLENRGVGGIAQGAVRLLASKTAGLPLALSFFCTLVETYGYTPVDLLEGDLIGIELLGKWFEDIGSLIGPDAAKLLQLLSLLDEPFDRDVVKLIAGEVLRADDSGLFFLLNRAFLVEKYDIDRWIIHDLVASLCRSKIEKRLLQRAHRAIGRYFEAAASEAIGPHHLHLMTRACRHFLATGQMEHEAAAILAKIASPLKRNSGYRQLIGLIKPLFLRVTGRERWLDYHYAHCLFIVGELEEALNATEELVQTDLSDDITLRLAVCRLYSETLGASGNSKHAEMVLANAIRATDLARVRGIGVRQALTALAGLEYRNGRIASAKARFIQSFHDAERTFDGRGMAIPLVWLGMIELRDGSASLALENFDRAARMFQDELDERGRAWAQTQAVEALLELGRESEAQSLLRSVFETYSDMGVRDRWLREQLERIISRKDLEKGLLETAVKSIEMLRRDYLNHTFRKI